MRKLLLMLAALIALPCLCAAQGTAPWGVWANRMNPGLPWTDPCNIQYVISPSPGRYDRQPAYVRVRDAASRNDADQFQRLFSQFFDDQPDNVVKLAPCHGGGRRTPTDGGAGGGASLQGLQPGINLYGGDYNNAWNEADGGDAGSCAARCEQDGQCRSFSWVKPGVQGRVSRCWLKRSVPQASRNDCCVSGVKSSE